MSFLSQHRGSRDQRIPLAGSRFLAIIHIIPPKTETGYKLIYYIIFVKTSKGKASSL